jgi:Tfp pilus assembly protein PilE
MPRIFPARVNKNREGFTFVEVLVALVMCAIMVSVVCTALITALKAEQMATWLSDAQRMTSEWTAHYYRNESPTNLAKRISTDWTQSDLSIQQATEETSIVWKVWTLTPNDRPSMSIRLCLHETASTNSF